MLDIYYLDGNKVKKGKVKDLARLKKKKLWIDATDITRPEADLLAKHFKLHPVTEEDMFLSEGRIKVEQFPEYLFCTFYGAFKEGRRVKLKPLDFVLSKNFLISTHKYKAKSYETLKENEHHMVNLFKRGTDIFLHRLIDRELDEFFPILEELDDEIEKIDEKIANKVHPEQLGKILEIKRKIVEIKKITFPQREKISFLARRNYKFVSNHALPYFRDAYDNAIRILDVVENQREAIGTTFDTYMTAVSNNMNEVMKVLSIIATIALPLTVISGIYGTNFIRLPGSENPEGFWVMMLIMAVVMVGMLIFFRDRKWF